MDFSAVGLDGLMGSDCGFSSLLSESETKQKGFGSDFFKQDRPVLEDNEYRSIKMAKMEEFPTSKEMLQQRPPVIRSNPLISDGQQQLLGFSSPRQESLFFNGDGLLDRSFQNTSLPYYHSTSPYNRNAGLSNGSLNMNLHGVFTGVRGPFTSSQWIEFEHQALFYKYITGNAPIPSNLLATLRKPFAPSGYPGLVAGSSRPNILGWGSFHLGFSGNSDPEPGRCRRTDGKKWRCSRDAVVDQKYCERHLNRGRHRSRKPVEGQTGPVVAKSVPESSASAVSVNAIAMQKMNAMPTVSDSSPSHNLHNRMLINKDNVSDRDSKSISLLSSVILKPKESPFSIPKQHNQLEESPKVDFGPISSDSILNPQRSFLSGNIGFDCSPEISAKETKTNPFRHFIDDWPKSRPDQSMINWPEMEETQSQRTQLSISIPVVSDYSSSSSSPIQEKLVLSPLKLSRQFDPIQMGLGMGTVLHEANRRPINRLPITWENSMGGPLGEVLNNTNNSTREFKTNTSALNLMSDGWESSPRLGSSPTGVLQKTTFGSLSNSSAGSSPRHEHNKIVESLGLCDDHLG